MLHNCLENDFRNVREQLEKGMNQKEHFLTWNENLPYVLCNITNRSWCLFRGLDLVREGGQVAAQTTRRTGQAKPRRKSSGSPPSLKQDSLSRSYSTQTRRDAPALRPSSETAVFTNQFRSKPFVTSESFRSKPLRRDIRKSSLFAFFQWVIRITFKQKAIYNKFNSFEMITKLFGSR